MSLLEVVAVTKRFGGVVANRDVSFTVRAGELVGIIGPNGAGKSTLFDVITGVTHADTGSVRIDGRDVTRWRPDQLNRLGVARTFQKLKPFADMTVLDNVMVGAFRHTADPRAARRAAEHALGRVGLADRADAHARVLSTGQRKRLELARALATRPRLLLLDEVTGGVDQGAVTGLLGLVHELHAQGLTLLVIEHNMPVIMDLAERVLALQLGELIADGAPADVMRDPRVIDAYLGRAWRS